MAKQFIGMWLRMHRQIEKNYQGDYIPEGQSFFNEEEMIDIPSNRHSLEAIWKSFWVICVTTFMLPLAAAFFVQPNSLKPALVLGLMFFVLMCLGQLIFTLADQKVYYSAKLQYRRFIDTFNKVLPVTKAEVALLVETNQKNREVYEESARKITEKFDSIVEDTILPALEDSIAVIMHSNLIPAIQNIEKTLDANLDRTLAVHDTGMRSMAGAFAEKLTDIMEEKMSSLTTTIVDVQGAISGLNENLQEHLQTLKDSLQETLEMQQLSMESMSEAYAGKFVETLEKTTSDLSAAFSGVKDQMEDLNFRLDVHVSSLSEMLSSQREVLEESGKLLLESGEVQEKLLSETKEIMGMSQENNRALNGYVHTMSDTVDRLTEQTMNFSKEAFQFTRETNEVQMRMSEDVKLSQSKLEAAVNETMSQYMKMNSMISDMMDNITSRMNEAMSNAGREIALGIKEVTADNSEAIANLTEQADKLRNDYETYFTRIEEHQLKSLEDMDFQVRTIIQTISEDIGVMLKQTVAANGDILERYKDETTDLLQSFDEQSRSIGLYAKEINLDIAELSSNLQSSVAEFSSKMEEGVKLTIGEFDSGLSELTQRITNTVESICDAVENLPAAFGRK